MASGSDCAFISVCCLRKTRCPRSSRYWCRYCSRCCCCCCYWASASGDDGDRFPPPRRRASLVRRLPTSHRLPRTPAQPSSAPSLTAIRSLLQSPSRPSSNRILQLDSSSRRIPTQRPGPSHRARDLPLVWALLSSVCCQWGIFDPEQRAPCCFGATCPVILLRPATRARAGPPGCCVS
jgi:hypothetical protein